MAMRVYGLYQKSRLVMALLLALALCGVTVVENKGALRGTERATAQEGTRIRDSRWGIPIDIPALYRQDRLQTYEYMCIHGIYRVRVPPARLVPRGTLSISNNCWLCRCCLNTRFSRLTK